VEYTNLPVGSYTFRVKAVDRDLTYSEVPVEVRVWIHPPYQEIAVLGVLGIAVIAGIVASGYAMKQRRERRKVQREREIAQGALLEAQTRLVEAMERELQTAHDVQMGLLPQEAPRIAGYDIAGRCIPANHVGGDHYTYLWLDEAQTKLAIVIADVSGHEMQAAMTVMRFSEILHYEAQGQQSPGEILTGLNHSVYGRLEKRLYVTSCIGVLNIAERSLEVSNAGHPPVYHRSGSAESIVEVGTSGFPLGVRRDTEYRGVTVRLGVGDVLVFYTDGVYEARNGEEEQYGFERLAGVVEGLNREGSAQEWVDQIIADVEEFSASIQREDDLTMVVVKVMDL